MPQVNTTRSANGLLAARGAPKRAATSAARALNCCGWHCPPQADGGLSAAALPPPGTPPELLRSPRRGRGKVLVDQRGAGASVAHPLPRRLDHVGRQPYGSGRTPPGSSNSSNRTRRITATDQLGWTPSVTLCCGTANQPAQPIIDALGKSLPEREISISGLSLVIQDGPEKHLKSARVWVPRSQAGRSGRVVGSRRQ
jgi:hypothetical protein